MQTITCGMLNKEAIKECRLVCSTTPWVASISTTMAFAVEAPAYDICYAYRPGSIWVSQHALSINGKREDITLEDFIAVGKSMNIKRAKGIIAEVQETINNWDYFSKKAKVDSEKSTLIKSTLIKVL